MFKTLPYPKHLPFILKCLLLSYLLTTGLLLLLALLLYRFQLSETIISICITAIYIIVTFLAGFLTGKKMGTRKFLWGLLMGSLYFAVLFVVSLFTDRETSSITGDGLTCLLLCSGSGMLGGMLG